MGAPKEVLEVRQMARQHIFVINHDPAFLEVIRLLLQDDLYNVTTTNYAPRTWEQIAALQPSLLLIDLSPRSQVGWELLERVRDAAATSGIPIIISSTDPRTLECVRQNPAQYGANAVLDKPFEVDTLLGAIHVLIGQA
ncbi:MAG TPA: response regulator [Ktedonobacterales bacterium]|nr:response regulator [Ktedonobacterales bacterium]